MSKSLNGAGAAKKRAKKAAVKPVGKVARRQMREYELASKARLLPTRTQLKKVPRQVLLEVLGVSNVGDIVADIRPLTPQEAQFCQYIADGRTVVESYMAAFKEYDKELARSRAQVTMRLKAVELEMNRLRSELEVDGTLSRIEARKLRAKIARDPKADRFARLAAIKDDSKMMGWDEPERVERVVRVVLGSTDVAGADADLRRIDQDSEAGLAVIDAVTDAALMGDDGDDSGGGADDGGYGYCSEAIDLEDEGAEPAEEGLTDGE